MKNTLVSIAMATYNGEKYLKEQLDSIYLQTYKNIEVVVADDCSTDSTVEILEQYSESYGLKYFMNEQNLGFVKNFEKAIGLCSGEYIALSDQDDIWEKNKLEILVSEIGPNLLIHSDCSIIDEQGEMIKSCWKETSGYRIDIDNLLFANVVTGCTVLIKKDLLKVALPFPKGLAYHDWWLAICAANENQIIYTNKSLVRYRQHSEQDTGTGIQGKISILSIIYSNILNRWNGIDFNRLVASRKQLQNLEALKNNSNYLNQSKVSLKDVILYFEDYINNKFHTRTFLIGMKYHKILYPHKNYLYLQNILMDIVG